MAQEQEERTVLSSKSAERFFFKQVSVFQIKKLRLSARFKVTQILYIIYYWQLRFDKLQKNCAKHIHLVSDDWKGFYKVKKVILFILCEWWRIYHLLKKTLTLSFFISSRVIFTNGFYSKTVIILLSDFPLTFLNLFIGVMLSTNPLKKFTENSRVLLSKSFKCFKLALL